MTNEQYQTYLTESIKIGAEMMYDMAKDIAGRTDFMTNLKVIIEFNNETGNVPELTIERSHVPNQEQLKHLFDIRQKMKYKSFVDKIAESCKGEKENG